MPAKKRRGRPPTISYDERRKLARLIRRHGASRTIQFSETKVGLQTLLRIAGEFGIALKPGRCPMDGSMKKLRTKQAGR